MGISTSAALEERLQPIREQFSGDVGFVADVVALARDLEVHIGCDSLLAIARAGLPTLAAGVRPAADPAAAFSGRSVVLSPAPTRLDELAAGWEPGEVHGLLLEPCLEVVGAEGNQAALIEVYVAFLARPDVRREIGADRPVDLHTVSALVAERASASPLGLMTFDLDVELALYRWLWDLLGAPGPAGFADEVSARRDLRLRLADKPVAASVVRLSEVPVAHLLPFEGPADTLADPALPTAEVLRVAAELALRSPAWSLRLRGLEGGSGAANDPSDDRPYVMSGQALRWLLDREVPIGPLRLGRLDNYVTGVIEMLGRGDDTEPLGAHLNVVVGMADDGIHLPLAEELAALAWLCDVHDEYVNLEALLDIRDQALRGELG